MGQKVNYNKNKTKTNKLKIITIVILCLFVLLILIKSFKDVKKSIDNQKNEPKATTIYTTVKDYQSLEELLASYNCNVLSKQETEDLFTIKLSFGENLYSGETSNERYFTNICKAVAEYIDYKNFRLIDEDKNIDIEVKCEKPYIVEFKINNDVNYYLNQDSKLNKKNRENKITNFTIQSPELQALIDGGWEDKSVNWGTRESTCDGYNIYFDEGIKYKVVARNVYNVIFTSKYTEQVAGGLTTNATSEAVELALGSPTFKNGDLLYGYVSNNNYLFFDFMHKQISVYPVQNITEDEEEKLKEYIEKMNETNDIKTFAVDITNLWNDYDVYDYSSNYVDLRYTLKGFKLDISSDSLKNGIFIYQNYNGNINVSNLKNVYLKSEDLVFEEEKLRSQEDSLKRKIEGEFSEEERYELGVKFSVYFREKTNSGEISQKGPTFYSRDEEYPDTELDRTLEISSYNWYDEYNFVYSVNDDGIYVFNPATNVNIKLIEINGEIKINSAGDGIIIYNNNEQLNLNLE